MPQPATRCYVCGDPGRVVRFWYRWRRWEVPLCAGHRARIWLWYWLRQQLEDE